MAQRARRDAHSLHEGIEVLLLEPDDPARLVRLMRANRMASQHRAQGRGRPGSSRTSLGSAPSSGLNGRQCPERLAMQVAWLDDELEGQRLPPSIRSALGPDRSEGVAEAGLGALGMLGLVTGVPDLVAGLPAVHGVAPRDG